MYTIALEDRLSTIGELKEQVTDRVTGLLQQSVRGATNLLSCDLRWGQFECSDDQELDYFMPPHQALAFHARIVYDLSNEELLSSERGARELSSATPYKIFVNCLARP